MLLNIRKKKKTKDLMEVVTTRRTYLMYGETKAIVDDWMQTLNDHSTSSTPIVTTPNGSTTTSVKEVNIDDFDLLTIIGQGSFGKVVQVRLKATGDIYAMKVLNKQTIIERNEIEHTNSEKSILTKLDHPFLMKLHYSFQSSDKLYLVMDFINGGEMYFHLQRERAFQVDRARFYAAEVVLALEYMHANGIIYRDLKPENILIDIDGHLKITDFGLSKEGMVDNSARTETFCGTPEYLAPEIVLGHAYNIAVDWWSLGSLIYEMTTGLPPFYDEDQQLMYTKKMSNPIQFPGGLDDATKDIIFKFLDKNPETRLRNPSEIKKHPFFQSIDWQALFSKTATPPFIPEVNGKESTNMIDPNFTDLNVKDEVGDRGPVCQKFENFTFVSPVKN